MMMKAFFLIQEKCIDGTRFSKRSCVSNSATTSTLRCLSLPSNQGCSSLSVKISSRKLVTEKLYESGIYNSSREGGHTLQEPGRQRIDACRTSIVSVHKFNVSPWNPDDITCMVS